MKGWVKYDNDFYLITGRMFVGDGLTGPSEVELLGEDQFGEFTSFPVPVAEIIPIATGLIGLIKSLFTATPEERKARREWREYKREQRHRRRIERIEAKAKAKT